MTQRMPQTIAFLLTLGAAAAGLAEERVVKITGQQFKRLHQLIKPQKGESPWRKVAWLTNVSEARRRAVAEDKPLIIFTAADGSPLSRT